MGFGTIGTEFVVNATTTFEQFGSSVTALSDGRFVVTWTDWSGTNGDASWTAVRGRIFEADGTPSGGDFLVNTATANQQDNSSLTALDGGGFVVTWTDQSRTGGDTNGSAIRAQVFDTAGNKSGSELLVNTSTFSFQNDSSVTALAGGGFVVTWTDLSGAGTDGDETAVRARVFAADGSGGTQIQVNTATAHDQYQSSVTTLTDGRFVVTWTDFGGTGSDADGSAVHAQLFDATGARSGGEFVVNTTTAGNQELSAVTALAGGGFVVTWTDPSQTGSDTTERAIRGQIFDAAGNVSGSEFLVNTTTPGAQFDGNVTALSDGRFVVTWTDQSATGGDTDGPAVRAQVFSAAGLRSGGEFLVATTTAASQEESSVAALADGRFVVTWSDYSATGGDTSFTAVRSQIFDPTRYDGDLTDETVIGGSLADVFLGNDGGDTLDGRGGNDTLDGGTGADAMTGGAGADTYLVDNAGDIVDESGGNAGEIDRVFSSVAVDLSDTARFLGEVEGVQLLGLDNISLTGNALRNYLIGNQADNLVDGGAGADAMWGRGGNDTYIVDDTGDLVDESLGGSSGTDLVQASISFNLGDTAQARGAVENLTLTGSANANAAGNGLANVIIGNSGANIVTGGGGNDTLTGGGANDVFLFNAAFGGGNVDTITDMNEAGDDTIWLDDAIFTALSLGTLIPNAFAISATGAQDATDRIIYNSGNGQLSYDSDGTGGTAAILFAVLDTGLGLTYTDFRVV